VALFTEYPYITDYVKVLATQQFDETSFRRYRHPHGDSPRAPAISYARNTQGSHRTGDEAGQLPWVNPECKRIREGAILCIPGEPAGWKGFDPYELYWAEVVKMDPLTVSSDSGGLSLVPQFTHDQPKGSWNPTSP